MTNSLELMRPKDDRLPFVCELNFTAGGGIHGDIVQVSIDLLCDKYWFSLELEKKREESLTGSN